MQARQLAHRPPSSRPAVDHVRSCSVAAGPLVGSTDWQIYEFSSLRPSPADEHAAVALPEDETERVVRQTLAQLGPDLVVATEGLELLMVVTARPAWMPPTRCAELRLAWIRGEGHVVGWVHPVPSAGRGMGRIEVPGGDPRLVVEAGVKELRTVTPPAPYE
jgi:hypothetical protein